MPEGVLISTRTMVSGVASRFEMCLPDKILDYPPPPPENLDLKVASLWMWTAAMASCPRRGAVAAGEDAGNEHTPRRSDEMLSTLVTLALLARPGAGPGSQGTIGPPHDVQGGGAC